MESSVVGINTLNPNLPESCGGIEEQRMLGVLNPLRDCSLFGNDSDDSELDELDIITKDFDLSPIETAKAPVNKTKTKAYCFLNDAELVCEVEGEVCAFCLRSFGTSEPKITVAIMQDSRERLRKVEVQENDLLFIIAGKACEEGVMEIIKKAVKEKGLGKNITRKVSKKIADYLEPKNKNSIIMIAKISREI